MRQVAIVTDSAASIPQSLSSRYEIDVVPLNLVFENRTYPDAVDGNTQQFYRSLKSARRPPTTTGASPGDHLQALRRASQRAPAVLYISVSNRFSGTYDSALQAAAALKEERPDLQVEVLDSQAAAMAQGFVVLEAARAAAQGADLPAVISRARAVMPHVGLLAVIDTLEYLARGGRVPKVQAWASALLSVKPVLEFRDQDVRLLTRTRTKRRAVAQLIPLFEQRGYKGSGLHLCVQHTNALPEAEELAAAARRRLEPAELLISEFTLVMGAHIGPGLLALAYYVEP
ncbi:MAG: DegV family protein [Dehalococcoidia bacterium]|nr:DegV family protein [Dehalococcoidia bacterium]